mmetsp:Transcript_114783/g.202599  ORF Transcript_114783/g.202599 Transcript_114783/m.202599 type:complete len:269 (+) Transcript_114783:1181-1987(+)
MMQDGRVCHDHHRLRRWWFHQQSALYCSYLGRCIRCRHLSDSIPPRAGRLCRTPGAMTGSWRPPCLGRRLRPCGATRIFRRLRRSRGRPPLAVIGSWVSALSPTQTKLGPALPGRCSAVATPTPEWASTFRSALSLLPPPKCLRQRLFARHYPLQSPQECLSALLCRQALPGTRLCHLSQAEGCLLCRSISCAGSELLFPHLHAFAPPCSSLGWNLSHHALSSVHACRSQHHNPPYRHQGQPGPKFAHLQQGLRRSLHLTQQLHLTPQ